MQNTSIRMQNAALNIVAPATFIPNPCDEFPHWREHRMQTSRLDLHPIAESDLVEYLVLLSDPVVMRFIGIEAGSIPAFEEIAKLHKSAIQTWKTKGYGRWSLFDRKSGDFVGCCGFRTEQNAPELICVIHERFWNKGLGQEAAARCLSYGFETFGFSEVTAFTRPENTGSKRLLNRLGAQFLGCIDHHGVEAAAYLLHPDSGKRLNQIH